MNGCLAWVSTKHKGYLLGLDFFNMARAHSVP